MMCARSSTTSSLPRSPRIASAIWFPSSRSAGRPPPPGRAARRRAARARARSDPRAPARRRPPRRPSPRASPATAWSACRSEGRSPHDRTREPAATVPRWISISLTEVLADEPAYRTQQVWEWTARGARSYAEMTNVPGCLAHAARRARAVLDARRSSTRRSPTTERSRRSSTRTTGIRSKRC